MKRFFSAFVVAVLLMVTVQETYAEQNGYSFYTHPVLGYTVVYPADWVVLEPDELSEMLDEGDDGAVLSENASDQQMVMFFAEDGSNINLSYEKTEKLVDGAELVSELESVEAILQIFYSKYETLIEVDDFEQDGFPCAIFGYKVYDESGWMYGVHISASRPQHVYYITMTTGTEEKAEHLIDTMLYMLETLQEDDGQQQFAPYVHPSLHYTLQYPANWIVVNYENIEDKIDELSQSVGERYSNMIASLKRQQSNIVALQMAYFLDLDNYGIFTVTALDNGAPLDQDLLWEETTSTCDILLQQLPNSSVYNEPAWLELAGKEVCAFTICYKQGGVQNYLRYYYYADNTEFYAALSSAVALETDEDLNAWLQMCDYIVGSIEK